MRILRWFLTAVVALIVLVTVASVVFNAVTSDADVPVTALWHGPFVRTDGFLTAYRRWGTHGTPIVLVGGFFEPSFVWDRVGPLLGRTHRVYALDLDGFGYTERRGPWTLQEWGDQLTAFERALRLRQPIVVGHSLGAAVAVEAARRGLASRIVLLDGDALRSGGPPGWVRSVVLHTPFFTTAYRLATRWSWPVHRALSNAYGSHPQTIPVSRWTKQLRAQGARDAVRGLLSHGIAGVTRAELRATRAQATVIWGAEDEVDSREAGLGTAHDLHARFIVIPGAPHLSMLVAPRAVAAAIAR
jgi:pimeloyl-ACP methyl ester carboxylesterase